ncbi:MAG: MBL fold metallo-hydrolase [Clostridia bacterium]|nr:MBL fold metallo-hydrolase [Clostridia bacterium]
MIIKNIGHAMFLLELDNGQRIVTDPVDHESGYPVERIAADTVLVSHKHHDHCAMENVQGWSRCIDAAGTYLAGCDVSIQAVLCFHDDKHGTLRGNNLMMILEAEGLKVVHLGDLGHPLTDEQAKAAMYADLLMVPVGGFYTIDAAAAKELADRLQARVVLPMHYRTKYNSDWPIATEEDFLAYYAPESIRRQHELRVTAGDLVCIPPVVLLDAQLKG